MRTKATIVIRPRKSKETVEGKAVILLCQDGEREYVYMCGRRCDLQTLLIWGAKHWFMLPPDESYFKALREAVESQVTPDDASTVLLKSSSCDAADRPTSGGSMAFVLQDETGETLRVDGVTDALFFIMMEDGSTANANGGSGMQKGCLLELGIEALFGKDVAERFREGKFDGMPAGIRAMYEDMHRKMRAHPGETLIIDETTMAAMTKGQKPN